MDKPKHYLIVQFGADECITRACLTKSELLERINIMAKKSPMLNISVYELRYDVKIELSTILINSD